MEKIKEFLSFFVDGTPKAIGHIFSVVVIAVQLIYVGFIGFLFAIPTFPLCLLFNFPHQIAVNIYFTIGCIITMILYSSEQGEAFVGEKYAPETITALLIGIIVCIWAR